MRLNTYLLCDVALLLALAAGGCGATPQPQQAVDHYVNAQMLADKGDYDAALAELRKAVQIDPNLSVAHAAAGDIYRHQGNKELARRSYLAATQSNPYAFKPQYNLGLIYQTLADGEQTTQKMQDYLQQAVRAYLRAITIRSSDFDTQLNLSACYFQLGKHDLAEQYCLEAIKLNPNSAMAHSNLGTIYDSQDKTYEAIREYKASVEIDVHQPQILLNLGSTYMRQGRQKQAIRTFELAAKEVPEDASPWEQMGAAYYHLGQDQQSLEAYAKALELNPKSAAAHRGIGVVYMSQFLRDRGKTDLRDKGLDAWNNSLEIQPDQPDLVKLVQKYQIKPEEPKL